MLKFSIEIGTSEKHTIDFQFNQTWKSLRIDVDGKPVAKKAMNLRFRENKEYTFEVGTEEKHEIKIELIKSLFPIGYGECSAWVYVDGEKNGEHIGKVSWKDRLFGGVGFLPAAAILTAFVLILSLIVSYIAYIIPIKINRTLNGVVIMTGDSMPEFIDYREIEIEGHYYRKIFKDDEFYGKLTVDEYLPERSEEDFQEKYDIHFRKDGFRRKAGYVWYTEKVKFGEMKIVRVGSVYMDPRGEKIVFTLDEESNPGSYHWSSGEGLLYAAPAVNREEAISLGNEFIRATWGEDAKPME